MEKNLFLRTYHENILKETQNLEAKMQINSIT